MAQPDAVTVAYLHPGEVSQTFLTSMMASHITDIMGPRRLMRGRYCAQLGSGPLTHAKARNKVIKAWLEEYDAPWLWWVDSDMGWPADTLERLMKVAHPTERPIVGGLCFGHEPIGEDGCHGNHYRPFPTIYAYDERPGQGGFVPMYGYRPNSLIRCWGTGSAMIVIHRSVFEKIRDRWGEVWYDHLPTPEGPGVFGEDLSFCIRAAMVDAPIHVHTGIRTNHSKTHDLNEATFQQSLEAPAATDEVDVIVPVLHRPQNVAPLLRSLRASTGLATAWFVCEPDDILEQAEVEKHGGRVIRHAGTFAEKVNAAYAQTSAPWVLPVGDDVVFHAGWLDHAQHMAEVHNADVVGTNDMANPNTMQGITSPHLMIRRSYIDEVGASFDGPGVVCHEGYRHNFVDAEIVAAAKMRGTWVMSLASVVEHRHPITGRVEHDDIYELGVKSYEADRVIFRRRVSTHAS